MKTTEGQIQPAGKVQEVDEPPKDALQRLLAYVKDKLQEPLERKYNAVCDTFHSSPMGPADVVDEARAGTDPEWLKVLPYLQDMILRAKEAEGRRVGFYGERGVGKSSLINAILGVDLLPVSSSSTCTAAVSEIMPWDLPHYSASIYFVSPDEWNLEMEMARELSAVTSTDEERDDRLESALEKIRALGGEGALLPYKKLLEKGSEHLVSTDPTELASKLRSYIDAEEHLWPLVDRVYIRGPFGALRQLGISLMDIPGVKDGYSSMSRRTEDALDKCDAVFFMPPLAKAVTKDTVNQLASLALVPHVGIVVTRLAEYLKDDRKRIKTVENAGSLIRNGLIDLAKLQGIAMRDDTPVYCVEATESSAEHSAALASFVEQELRRPSDTDVRNHARYLQNELNCTIRLLREAILGRNENKADAKEILDMACATLAGELKETTEAEASLHVRHKLSSLLVQPNAAVVTQNFEGFAYNTIRLRIRQSDYGLTLDMPGVGAWDDLDPACASPSLKQVLGEFREHVQVTDDEVDTWQRRLEGKRTRVLLIAKFGLLRRLARASKVEEALDLWETVRNQSGRGLKQFYLDTLRTKLPAVVDAQRKAAEAELVSWRKDTLAELEHATKSVFAQLQAVLAPLCNVATISPEKRAFFEDLLAPIDVLNQRPDVEDPSPIAEQDRILETGEPKSLMDIHTLHACLTPIPTALAKLYSNTTINIPGFVYVMTNSAFRHGLFKIGLTTRPLENRAKQLYTTGVPQPFDIKHFWATDNCRVFESLMHKLFAAVRENKRREFFQAELELIIEVGNTLHGILQA